MLAMLAYETDASNPAVNLVQTQYSFAGIDEGFLDVYAFDSKSRYTTGSIVSIIDANSPAGEIEVTGTGTSWLSAGITALDLISLGQGYLALAAIQRVVSDTKLILQTSYIPDTGYTGSYTIFLGSAGTATQGKASTVTQASAAELQTLVNIYTDSATSSDPLVTERIYISRSKGRAAADPAFTISAVAMNLFSSKK